MWHAEKHRTPKRRTLTKPAPDGPTGQFFWPSPGARQDFFPHPFPESVGFLVAVFSRSIFFFWKLQLPLLIHVSCSNFAFAHPNAGGLFRGTTSCFSSMFRAPTSPVPIRRGRRCPPGAVQRRAVPEQRGSHHPRERQQLCLAESKRWLRCRCSLLNLKKMRGLSFKRKGMASVLIRVRSRLSQRHSGIKRCSPLKNTLSYEYAPGIWVATMTTESNLLKTRFISDAVGLSQNSGILLWDGFTRKQGRGYICSTGPVSDAMFFV